MNLSRAERLILKDVFFSSDGVHLYTLHTRFKFPPGLLIQLATSLEKKDLVTFDGSRVALSKEGRKFGLRARFDLFQLTNKPWREVPERFLSRRRKADAPYVPHTDRVHWSLLPDGWRRKK